MFAEHRQLTAADFIFPRQLTAEGYYRILHVFLSQIKCVNNKFHKYILYALLCYSGKSTCIFTRGPWFNTQLASFLISQR